MGGNAGIFAGVFIFASSISVGVAADTPCRNCRVFLLDLLDALRCGERFAALSIVDRLCNISLSSIAVVCCCRLWLLLSTVVDCRAERSIDRGLISLSAVVGCGGCCLLLSIMGQNQLIDLD
jgi:hypothetical protein